VRGEGEKRVQKDKVMVRNTEAEKEREGGRKES